MSNGFSELKFSIQSEENPELLKTVQSQVLDKLPDNIVRTIDVMNEEILHKIVQDLLLANKILFAGIGDSVYFCELFGRNLRCFDKPVEFYQQIHDIDYAARRYGQGDLVIIITASGKPKRLLELEKNVKSNGATVHCLTNYGTNPLAALSNCQLCFWGEQRIVNGYNVTDRSGLMMLVRLLCEEFWKKYCEKF